MVNQSGRVNQVGVTRADHDSFRTEIENRMISQELISASASGIHSHQSMDEMNPGQMRYEDLKKMADDFSAGHYAGMTASGTSATVSSMTSSYGGHIEISELHKPDMMVKIIAIREKISSLVDSSHVLSSFMHPQSIRETIKEMRHEIRECKKAGDITESDILSFMEGELNDGFERSAEARLPF